VLLLEDAFRIYVWLARFHYFRVRSLGDEIKQSAVEQYCAPSYNKWQLGYPQQPSRTTFGEPAIMTAISKSDSSFLLTFIM